MARLFRSKSGGLGCTTCSNNNNPNPIFGSTLPDHHLSLYLDNDEDEEEDEEVEEIDDEESYGNENKNRAGGDGRTTAFGRRRNQNQSHQFPIVAILVAALRKSTVICSVESEEVVCMDISCPTNVRHVSHVTFDRFDGFLGVPVELEPELPHKVPSASASVFGVSANSMQCSFDRRGNSVPTILLMMQNRLYSEGGLQAEGIFRINPDNSQEEYVRDQLNRGVVPRGIDVHCLAGLIKAWFRELPAGVLDSLTPEQVMRCNSEDECTQLVMLLPPTEATLLDWGINLMADVVQHEHHNKMNARNIAMVFAPNMTQMADPLTALIHAVQVMNFLKTLIVKTLIEREVSPSPIQFLSSSANCPSNNTCHPHSLNSKKIVSGTLTSDGCLYGGMKSEKREEILSFNSRTNDVKQFKSVSSRNSPVMYKKSYQEEEEEEEEEGIMDKLNLRKGVLKLCKHPVFQLSKSVKKGGRLGIVNSRGGSREAWA